MDRETEIQQWLEIADNDLAIADFSAKNMWPIPYAIICFHCQQSVEKYLKMKNEKLAHLLLSENLVKWRIQSRVVLKRKPGK